MSADSFPVTRHPGSGQDVGPFLNVITWILLITSGLAVLTRLVTKKALHRRIDVDDAFVIAALVCHGLPLISQDPTDVLMTSKITSIGSGVAVSIQTANGLGRGISTLAKAQVVAYEKVSFRWCIRLPELKLKNIRVNMPPNSCIFQPWPSQSYQSYRC